MKKTLRFLKRSRFTGQHEPVEPNTVREFDIGEKEGQLHPDVLDALLRGPEPMAEELDAEEVAGLRKASAKAAAAAKAKADEEEGKAPPPTTAKPKSTGKKSKDKPAVEESEKPEGEADPEV